MPVARFGPPANSADPGLPGEDGDDDSGGDGATNPVDDPCGAGGGGGGGGLAGGGGGGSGAENAVSASGGGGGGGSSLADGGTIEDGVRETDGKVVISWTAIEATRSACGLESPTRRLRASSRASYVSR